ncbi:MAG: bifunctional hydroxymethylpyrimidine kinase/phosphomethylpyrimidine kinase [Deltaproteobacteria bacterium]|nr:bifunctional hydroxymethylpyrimidine kinase/phosphomethylpyrimidine kinase [Deltaproteobacteria bacterium]
MQPIRKALTIAGSDSGGGAGIQADLKTFAAHGVYGTSAITAVTAQNTVGVTAICALSPKLIAAQIDAVVSDIGAQAVKTGMLANAAIIETVARKIRQHRLQNVVVDPVMVATSGDLLIQKSAVAALRGRLIPMATVVTPNLPEAEELTGMKLRSSAEIDEAARRIVKMGAKSVVIKGGHRSGPAVDLFFDGKTFHALYAPRIQTNNTHGTGCTFSAAIAAYLAKGEKIEGAVICAKRYITQAIKTGFVVGAGHSPVHHFYRYWKA